MLLQKRDGSLSNRKWTESWTESLPVSEGSCHNLERRVSVHQHGATGWYLMNACNGCQCWQNMELKDIRIRQYLYCVTTNEKGDLHTP